MSMHTIEKRQGLRRVPAALLAILLLVGVLTCLPACTERGLFTATYLDVFDTVLTVTIAADSHTEATTHCTAIHNLLADLHRQFDIYRHHDGITNLYDLNRAGGEPVTISREIMDILLLGKDFYEKTDGRLNLCIGALTALWHHAREFGDRLPDPEALAEAMLHISPDVLILDEMTMTARLTDSAAAVDVGALAKGYALMRVKAYAEKMGLDSLLVSLGGQVLAIGTRPNGEDWAVSLASPTGDEPSTVPLRDAVIATSGDSQRTLTVDGRTYHHIIDPATGYPAEGYRAVTVILPLDALSVSDAYSTALFLLPEADGRALIAPLPNAAVRWTYADGSNTTTENWPLTQRNLTNRKETAMRPTKYDGLLAAALMILALLIGGGVWLVRALTPPVSREAIVELDGVLYTTLPLDTDTICTLPTGHTIEVRNGSVSVTSAPCPDQICVKHHAVRHAGECIVCLPARLTVTLQEVPDV